MVMEITGVAATRAAMCEKADVCRTCLRADNLTPIFTRAEQHERYTVALFLATGLQIERNDGLPQTICWTCTELVNSAIDFRNRCHRTEQRLLQCGYRRPLKKRKKLNGRSDSKETDKKSKGSKIENESNPNFEHGQETKAGLVNLKIERDGDTLKEDSAPSSDGGGRLDRPEREFVDTNKGSRLYRAFERRYSDDESNLSPGYNSDQNHIVKSSVPRRKANRPQRKKALSNKEKRELLLSLVEGQFDPRGPIQCRICKKTVGRWSSFRSHSKLHLGFDFVCEYCGKSFISITQLRRHKSSKHGEARTLSCQHCSYKALDKPQLILHERREHTGERPFVCDACGASYHSRRCLIQHIENHSVARTIQCDQCPSMFKSRRHLARHTYGCHTSAAYSYRCHVCRQLYKKLKYVRRHMHKMHGLTTQQQGPIAKVKL